MVNSTDQREMTRVSPRARAMRPGMGCTDTPGREAVYSYLASRGREAKAGQVCVLQWSLVLRGLLLNDSVF